MANNEQPPKLVIELGAHVNTDKEYQDLYDDYEAGNPSSSAWPSAVSKRMDDYNPGSLSSDSLTGIDTSEFYPEEVVKEHVWMATPTGALKNLQSVLVAGGDMTLMYLEAGSRRSFVEKAWGIGRNLLAFGAIGGVTGLTVHELKRIEDGKYSATTEDPIDPLIQPSSPEQPTEVESEDSDDLEESQKAMALSRRKFIRTGFNAGLVTCVTPLVATIFVSEIPTHKLDFVYETQGLASTIRRAGLGPVNSAEIDGRTAIMIEKALFLRDLTGDDTALVMGNGHVYNYDFYLNNPQARRDAIRELAIKYGSFAVGPLAKENENYQLEPKRRLELIGKELVNMSLHLVSRPYPEGTDKEDWNKQALQDAVKPVGVIEVPACRAIADELNLPV